MIIDTKEIEMNFLTMQVDGLVLVNPREIGISIANQMIDDDVIWKTDIYNNVEEYLLDILTEAADTAFDILEENGRDDIL